MRRVRDGDERDSIYIKYFTRIGHQAGKRGKIAVISTDPHVDPIAACLGPKDAHIRAINRELRGEKINVIEWSDEPTVLAVRALAPAKISEGRVIDTEGRAMDAIVSERPDGAGLGQTR